MRELPCESCERDANHGVVSGNASKMRLAGFGRKVAVERSSATRLRRDCSLRDKIGRKTDQERGKRREMEGLRRGHGAARASRVLHTLGRDGDTFSLSAGGAGTYLESRSAALACQLRKEYGFIS